MRTKTRTSSHCRGISNNSQGYMLASSSFRIALTDDGSGRRSAFLTTPLTWANARHFRITQQHIVCSRRGPTHSSASVRRVRSSSRRDTQCAGGKPVVALLPAAAAAAGDENQRRSTLGSAPQMMSSLMRADRTHGAWPYATQTDTMGDIEDVRELPRFQLRLFGSAPSSSNLYHVQKSCIEQSDVMTTIWIMTIIIYH